MYRPIYYKCKICIVKDKDTYFYITVALKVTVSGYI